MEIAEITDVNMGRAEKLPKSPMQRWVGMKIVEITDIQSGWIENSPK